MKLIKNNFQLGGIQLPPVLRLLKQRALFGEQFIFFILNSYHFCLKYSYHIFCISVLRLIRHNDVMPQNENAGRENKKLNRNLYNALTRCLL